MGLGSGYLQGSEVLSGIPDVTDDALMPIKTALLAKRPIAIFFAMLASSWGHSIPQVANLSLAVSKYECCDSLQWYEPADLCL